MTGVASAARKLVQYDVSMDVMETDLLIGLSFVHLRVILTPTLAIGGRDVLVAQIRS
jgi:hypothetical protein